MAKVYFITGSLGAGKTLCGVDMAKTYLSQGRRVATNVNLFTEHLCKPGDKHSRIIRVPDAPNIDDLRAIGFGSSDQDEKTHGLLLLDELGTWFNARDFANKERLKVIKWMIHMRKRRWDVAFIVQDFTMVDKQARGNIAQHLVLCKSSKDLWLFKPFPKFHIANVIHTVTRANVDKWYYKGTDVYNAYDTEQLFHTEGDEDIEDADIQMAEKERQAKSLNSLYCVLPPYYLGHKAQEESQQMVQNFNRARLKFFGGMAASICFIGFLLFYIFSPGDTPQTVSAQEVIDGLTDQPIYHEPMSIYEIFDGFAIARYNQIGPKITFTFSSPWGEISQSHIESFGYQVKARSPSEALIIDQERNHLSIF